MLRDRLELYVLNSRGDDTYATMISVEQLGKAAIAARAMPPVVITTQTVVKLIVDTGLPEPPPATVNTIQRYVKSIHRLTAQLLDGPPVKLEESYAVAELRNAMHDHGASFTEFDTSVSLEKQLRGELDAITPGAGDVDAEWWIQLTRMMFNWSVQKTMVNA